MPGILLAVILLIVYGSLYPWEFHSFTGSPFSVLLSSSQVDLDRFGLRDIAVNLVLYMPLGATACLAFRRSRFSYVYAVLVGALLSTAVEIAQVYTTTRKPSLMDVACNVGGAALGALLVGLFDLHETRPHAAQPGERGARVLLIIGAAYFLFPLFPVLGRAALYEKLRVIYHLPVLQKEIALSFAAVWFALGRLGWKAWPRLPRWWLAASILLVPVQLFIVERQPLASELIGAAAGVGVFALCGQRRQTATWFAWVFALVILLRGLAPFHLQSVPQDFSWVPFGASLGMEWQAAIAILLEKVFWYFTAIWILRDAGVRWRTATLVAAELLAAIEIAQIWLPGRSPEITDPLLAVLGGTVMWLLRAEPV